MRQEFINGVKVDKSIVPLEYKFRKAPQLIIGKEYFVSFGNNIAHPCKLITIHNILGRIEIEVEIKLKTNSKKTKSSIHTLFSDEIGTTTEEAVLHEIFF